MGGAPGGASRNTSLPSRTRRAWRDDGTDGRSRAVRKRTNSALLFQRQRLRGGFNLEQCAHAENLSPMCSGFKGNRQHAV